MSEERQRAIREKIAALHARSEEAIAKFDAAMARFHEIRRMIDTLEDRMSQLPEREGDAKREDQKPPPGNAG